MSTKHTLRLATQIARQTNPLSQTTFRRLTTYPRIPPSTTMTTASFVHIDPASYTSAAGIVSKPWGKVDDGGRSFTELSVTRPVHNARGRESSFALDKNGFEYHTVPARETQFVDDASVRDGYYAEVEALLRDKVPRIKRVVIFDHTIRRRDKASPRQPVQQVHVDQTAAAAEARVFRHLPEDEAAQLARGRYQIINVWRPIGHAASDFPLAFIDWRSTEPAQLIATDLLYPVRGAGDDEDDRGKEKVATRVDNTSTEGYEARGETFAVAPSEKHQFWYLKDMRPEEVALIKCFDSRGDSVPEKYGQRREGVASYTPHTAFVDPETPEGAKGRQSIEVRCLVFYEDDA